MKLRSTNVDNLPDGIYYYCANCGHWFGQWQPASGYPCPSCGWQWQNARGVYTKETTTTNVSGTPRSEAASQGCIYWIFLVLLAGIAWACFSIYMAVQNTRANFQTAWANFLQQIAPWLEFIGSISLSLVALATTTLLLFALFRILVYPVLFLVLSIVSVFSTTEHQHPTRYQTNEILETQARFLGTLINLFSSLCALLIVSRTFQRPPDYWDFGIQFLIALIIEFVVFQSR